MYNTLPQVQVPQVLVALAHQQQVQAVAQVRPVVVQVVQVRVQQYKMKGIK
jgi:hypothetical protein